MKTRLLLALLLCCSGAIAQLNPLGSSYHFNSYLANPAMCSPEYGMQLHAALKGQWTAIDGAPIMQTVSFSYHPTGKKVSLGLVYYHEKAGVIGGNFFKATYSYHVPLDGWEVNYLDLGLSLGVQSQQLDRGKVKGDLDDPSLESFEQRGSYVDGDFGAAMRLGGLKLQAAALNLKKTFSRDTKTELIDRSLYMLSAGYRFSFYHPVINSLEPQITYRGIQHYKPILDISVAGKLMDEKLLGDVIYHSTGSLTVGVGTIYNSKLSIFAAYTSDTSKLKGYTNGEFEIALSYKLR